MSTQHIQIPGLFGAGIYSHAVRVGNILFCSGVSAREPNGRIHSAENHQEQVRYWF
jgi:enamine deaminase RidA (YjgF/YER057c/UK114 family)